MIDTKKLEDAIAGEEAGADSVEALVNSLREQLKAELTNDPTAQAAVDAAADKLIARADKIAALIAAPAVP